MKRTLLSVSALALAATLSACGGRDEAANNLIADNDMNAMTADSSPFAKAEQEMNDKMMAAVGSDAGQSWAKKMIEHHEGAIAMSRIMLEQNPSADVAMMARQGIEKQQKDIEDIRKVAKEGSPNQQSAELYRPAMMDMHQKMMSAKGADVSETFMRKMLEHHKGAVAMSDVALQNGVSGALRAQVQKTRDDNKKEAEMVEAMLRGEGHQQAMGSSGAKSAAQAKAEPAPADKAKDPAAPKTSSATAPKPAPRPAPADPHAGMVMNNSQ